jgi:heme/copper-type cytochrome/quinol oxidase subunit 2
MSRAGRIALVAAVVVVAVVAFIILKPSSSSDKQSSTPTVRVNGGKPVGGIQTLTFAKGGTVAFQVTSDVPDEVHVHGYDVHKDVSPGHPVKFRFPASIDGEFVVELERRTEQIASLKVTP